MVRDHPLPACWTRLDGSADVDVTGLANVPEALDILGPHQTVDDLAEVAGTIGYEILTSLGARYRRPEGGA